MRLTFTEQSITQQGGRLDEPCRSARWLLLQGGTRSEGAFPQGIRGRAASVLERSEDFDDDDPSTRLRRGLGGLITVRSIRSRALLRPGHVGILAGRPLARRCAALYRSCDGVEADGAGRHPVDKLLPAPGAVAVVRRAWFDSSGGAGRRPRQPGCSDAVVLFKNPPKTRRRRRGSVGGVVDWVRPHPRARGV